MNSQLSEEYLTHPIFNEISHIKKFYDDISWTCMGFIQYGLPGNVINYSSDLYGYMSGVVDSVEMLLKKGRINDSYSLVRKFFDTILTDIYINLVLKEEFDYTKTLVVEEAKKWLEKKIRIPGTRAILKRIRESTYTKELYPFFGWETNLKKIREYLDDYIHGNSFVLMLMNCENLYLPQRITELKKLETILKELTRLHIAFIFHLNAEHMMASDYIDALECGYPPPEGSEAWIAPYAQKVFDRYIAPYNTLAQYIKEHCYLEID